MRDEDVPAPEGRPRPRGGSSAAIRARQERLADLGYLPRAGVDGQTGPQTRFAVWPSRSGRASSATASPAAHARGAREAKRPTPRTQGSGRRVEVLLDRQLALYIEGGSVVRTLHVSTGAPGFDTPAGSFSVVRKERNRGRCPYKVWLP